ncbi:MAG: LapA family protein [Desulfatiglandaceae bacterium]
MVRKIIFWILIALLLVFIVQNTQVVQVKFLIWTMSMSRGIVLLGTFLMGVVVTLLVKLTARSKRTK